ncbi:MAG: hypothetical protein HC849_33810 [Oscillatoriales cyanobacterium RU_3_3]|nr:hypothetical protein [Microcoleus sp. SU_5_6]NJM63991.1 hypothetical protein [Oscillatoriales cyanobacterium RU_3_3]NJR23689.1 hypothetical protein [Richelia sp. CSU_2_1]
MKLSIPGNDCCEPAPTGIATEGSIALKLALSTINDRLSTVNDRLSTIDCQLSTVNYQLSTIDCQIPFSNNRQS